MSCSFAFASETNPPIAPRFIESKAELGTITIDRPAKLNALTAAIWGDLTTALDSFAAADDIRLPDRGEEGELRVGDEFTVDGASAFSYPLIFLPFISSAFVPTDSMPGPVAWFAENQPVTSMVDSIRALFAQQPVGNEIWIALATLTALGRLQLPMANRPKKLPADSLERLQHQARLQLEDLAE